MAGTFTTLAKEADFSDTPTLDLQQDSPSAPNDLDTPAPQTNSQSSTVGVSPFGSLAYNINIQLPESRDPAVYNAIFKALREHFR